MRRTRHPPPPPLGPMHEGTPAKGGGEAGAQGSSGGAPPAAAASGAPAGVQQQQQQHQRWVAGRVGVEVCVGATQQDGWAGLLPEAVLVLGRRCGRAQQGRSPPIMLVPCGERRVHVCCAARRSMEGAQGLLPWLSAARCCPLAHPLPPSCCHRSGREGEADFRKP